MEARSGSYALMRMRSFVGLQAGTCNICVYRERAATNIIYAMCVLSTCTLCATTTTATIQHTCVYIIRDTVRQCGHWDGQTMTTVVDPPTVHSQTTNRPACPCCDLIESMMCVCVVVLMLVLLLPLTRRDTALANGPAAHLEASGNLPSYMRWSLRIKS